jgi:ATP-binding cassette, subfamily F, member 3
VKPKAISRKPLEARIKRLEELMARLHARRAEIDARLADATLYEQQNSESLRNLLSDQAYVAKEIEQVEGEWLEKQAELEQP